MNETIPSPMVEWWPIITGIIVVVIIAVIAAYVAKRLTPGLLLFIIFVGVVSVYPFLDAYVLKGASFEVRVDPEIMSGLLAASSILSGFSSFLLAYKKPIEKTPWYLLLRSLSSIALSGIIMVENGLGMGNIVEALLFMEMAFLARANEK